MRLFRRDAPDANRQDLIDDLLSAHTRAQVAAIAAQPVERDDERPRERHPSTSTSTPLYEKSVRAFSFAIVMALAIGAAAVGWYFTRTYLATWGFTPERFGNWTYVPPVLVSAIEIAFIIYCRTIAERWAAAPFFLFDVLTTGAGFNTTFTNRTVEPFGIVAIPLFGTIGFIGLVIGIALALGQEPIFNWARKSFMKELRG
jgi:hypothetical protein